MKVALYIRVSTEEQLNGYSIDAQIKELREYAKKHNYSIYKEYVDGGISGGTLKRPALTELIEDVKENKFELIIFVKLDRWFRSVAHYYKIQEILEQHNVKWLATQEDYETLTSSGRFKVNIMLSVSQQFKDATSERINSVFNYKVKEKKEIISGTKIYGYDIVDKHYVINEEEAKNIKLLFEKYLEIGSLNSTYNWWIQIKNELFETFRLRLMNIKYNGKYKYKDIIIDDFIPKIIDDETFNKVQNLLKKNYKLYPSKANKHTYLLSGVVYCGECGMRMSGYPYASGKSAYYCPRKEKHKCNNRKFIREEVLINYIFANLPIKIDEYNLSIKEKPKSINNSSRINYLKSKQNRITNLYIDGIITKEDIQYKQLKEIIDEIQLLEKQQKESEKSNKIIKYDLSAMKMYDKLDSVHKQLFFKNIIERICVLNGEVISFDLATR